MTDRGNFPKVAAAVIYSLPKATLKTGFSYLKMKKRAQKAEKSFRRGLVKGGVPPNLARMLSEEYSHLSALERTIFDEGFSFLKRFG